MAVAAEVVTLLAILAFCLAEVHSVPDPLMHFAQANHENGVSLKTTLPSEIMLIEGDIDCDGDDDLLVSSDALGGNGRISHAWYLYLNLGNGEYSLTGQELMAPPHALEMGEFNDGECKVAYYWGLSGHDGVWLYMMWDGAQLRYTDAISVETDFSRDPDRVYFPEPDCEPMPHLLIPSREIVWPVTFKD